jgi:uncharacterized protein with GYD domain
MPLYVLLSNLTDEGRKTVRARPERIKEVNREIEGMGAQVLHQYALLGPYDFISILEAPDNETIARVSVQLGARGTVQIMSMPAIPLMDYIDSINALTTPPAERRG